MSRWRRRGGGIQHFPVGVCMKVFRGPLRAVVAARLGRLLGGRIGGTGPGCDRRRPRGTRRHRADYSRASSLARCNPCRCRRKFLCRRGFPHTFGLTFSAMTPERGQKTKVPHKT